MPDMTGEALRDEIRRASASISPITITDVLNRPSVWADPEPDEHRGDDLMVDYLPQRPDPCEEPSTQKGWLNVLAAAAATVLVVMGVVVVAGGDSGDVVTDPASSAATPEPDPPPSVVDGLAYRWSRVFEDSAASHRGGDLAMYDVVAGGPGLVAVGSAGSAAAVWTSEDGVAWSRVPHGEATFGGSGKQWMDTVLVGGPGLMAVGGDEQANAVWTSVDGSRWKRVAGDVFPGGGVHDVIVGGPGFVAVGGNEQGAVVWTSTDGVDWSRVPDDRDVFGYSVGDGAGMTAVTVGGPGLVAVGSDGLPGPEEFGNGHARAVVWTSVDGLTWSRVAHDESIFGGPGHQTMEDVVVGGPGLVAVGSNDVGAAVWTSVDGVTWSRVPDDEAVFRPGYVITSVMATSEGLVAPGDGGDGWNARIWTSRDGITWARADDDAVFRGVLISDLVVGESGLVAVGADGGPGSREGAGSAGVWLATLEN